MASLTNINPGSTPITTLKAALTAKSLITATLYEDADCLIISTPLTSKVFKLKIAASVFIMSYGDAWTSAETVTNEIIFCQRNTGTISSLYLIAETAWIFLAMESSTQLYCGYLGAMDNGDIIAVGFASSTNTSFNTNCIARNITAGTGMFPVTFFGYSTFKTPSGYLVKMPLMWFNQATKEIIMNGANPAQTLGLYVSSWSGGALVSDLGTSYYLTSSMLSQYYGGAVVVGNTALLCEFTP